MGHRGTQPAGQPKHARIRRIALVIAVTLQAIAATLFATTFAPGPASEGPGVRSATMPTKAPAFEPAAFAQPNRRPSSNQTPTPPPSPSPTATDTPTTTDTPPTTEHYTANGVFDGTTYSPGAYGFNLVDVSTPWWITHLPSGTNALVWLGLCDGADSTFVSTIQPYLNNPNVFGYYLYDEPDPTGHWKTQCTATNLKAESDWIHANDPGKKTYLMLMNLSSSANPNYQGTYNPANTGIDLFGLDPYPCRSELAGCDDTYITKAAAAAEAWGIPAAQLVPTFQTFGGGAWVDDGGGSYALPTAAQEQQLIATWASVLPHPVFDYSYSWGTQNGDTSLDASPDLLPVIAQHNASS